MESRSAPKFRRRAQALHYLAILQVRFEDFVDVTIALQDAGYADVSRTVANGGSAGGLLMGAVANMAPERYAGIEADVPFVDALTSVLVPSLPLAPTPHQSPQRHSAERLKLLRRR